MILLKIFIFTNFHYKYFIAFYLFCRIFTYFFHSIVWIQRIVIKKYSKHYFYLLQNWFFFHSANPNILSPRTNYLFSKHRQNKTQNRKPTALQFIKYNKTTLINQPNTHKQNQTPKNNNETSNNTPTNPNEHLNKRQTRRHSKVATCARGLRPSPSAHSGVPFGHPRPPPRLPPSPAPPARIDPRRTPRALPPPPPCTCTRTRAQTHAHRRGGARACAAGASELIRIINSVIIFAFRIVRMCGFIGIGADLRCCFGWGWFLFGCVMGFGW